VGELIDLIPLGGSHRWVCVIAQGVKKEEEAGGRCGTQTENLWREEKIPIKEGGEET